MEYYTVEKFDSPIIALALHDGHYIPEDLMQFMLLTESERFKEEDPFTAEMANISNVSKVLVSTSRFYTDLNREKEKAMYLKPEDAWGLHVWHEEMPEKAIRDIRNYYDKFYQDIKALIESTIKQYGYFFILDIHSYNHRRESPDMEAALETHPEINLGTFYNAKKWPPILSQFKGYVAHCKINNKYPDVRNNIIFKGGGMAQWVIKNFGEKGGIVSVEFKKTFMDEWTGRVDMQHVLDINRALKGVVPLMEFELEKLKENNR